MDVAVGCSRWEVGKIQLTCEAGDKALCDVSYMGHGTYTIGLVPLVVSALLRLNVRPML